MSWFPFYLLALVALRCFAPARESKMLSILLVAGICSTVLAHTVMPQIHASWKLAIPGAVETLTIMSLVTMANHSRQSFFQVILLLIAWWCHLQCFADIQNNTNVVYDNYELVLGAVAIGQLLVCHDTIRHIVCSVVELFRFPRNRIIRPASVSADILRSAGDSGVSDVP